MTRLASLLKSLRLTSRNIKRSTALFIISSMLIGLVLPIVGFLIPTYNPTYAADGWWNEDWRYRTPIDITSATDQSSVYLVQTLDTSDSNKFKPDCSDLRFLTPSGQLIPYHLVSGCGTNNTQVQLLFAELKTGQQTIYLYYGNPNVSTVAVLEPFNNPAAGVTATIQTEQSSASPIAHWKFDEGYGAIANDSASNHNGSSTSPIWQDEAMCVSGKCQQFGTIANTVTVPDGPELNMTDSLTISAWIRPTALANNTNYNIVAKQDWANRLGYRFGLAGNGAQANKNVLFLGIGNGVSRSEDVSADISINNLGHWYYVAATFSNSTVKLYVDGALRSQNAVSIAEISNAVSSLTIGRHNSGGEYFKGNIDDLKMYSYARSQQQIQQDYLRGIQSLNQQQANLSNGLVGYWKMDEASWSGAAGEVKDDSGNGNHGTAVAGTTLNTGKYGKGGSFDGVDDYVSVGNINVDQIKGVALWLYVASPITYTSPETSPLEWSGQTGIKLGNSTGNCPNEVITIYNHTGGGGVNGRTCWNSTTESVPVGWNHIAAMWNESAGRYDIYLNGQLKSPLVGTNSPGIENGESVRLGMMTSTSESYYYTGLIDEVRLYSDILSNIEISQLYNYAPKPVSYWDFEEGSGNTAYDKSGRSNNGTWSGTSQRYGSGRVGKAGYFSQTNDYIAANSTGMVASQGTVSVWAKNTNPNNQLGYMYARYGTEGGTSNRIYLLRYSDGSLRVGLGDSGVRSAGGYLIDAQNWHHYSLVWNSGTYYVYVDGSQVYSGTYVGLDTINQADPARIGQISSSVWTGGIDEVKTYNYARTPGQILEDMQSGTSNELNPVGYWKFEPGQELQDSSSYGNNGTSISCTSIASAVKGGGLDCSAPGGVGLGNKTAYQSNSFSIAMWINAGDINVNSAGANSNIIMGKETYTSNGFRYGINQYGRPVFWTTQSGGTLDITSPRSINDQRWHYLVVTYDAALSQGRMYIDGQQVATAAGIYLPNTTSSMILNGGVGGTTRSNGSFDELKFYNSPLTPQQIAVDYNQSSAMIAGVASTQQTAGQSGNSTTQPANNQDAAYCVPGSTDYCAKPVGEWNFEEKTGSIVKDSSGNGNSGTISGATWSQGKHGGAASFDGDSSYITIPNSSTLGTLPAVTYQFWAKPRTSGESGSGRIIQKGSTYITVTSTNRLLFEKSFSGQSGVWQSAASSIPFNKWSYISVMYDSSSPANIPQFYVNGIALVVSTVFAPSGEPIVDSSPLYIGMNDLSLIRGFDGQIDDVRIYNYARTPAQVAWDYNNGKPAAHYKMDECSGTTIHDASNNGLHGLLNLGSSGTTLPGTCSSPNTAWSLGKMGRYNGSMNFDGVDDAITISSASQLNFSQENFSLSAWVKIPVGSTKQVRIINKRTTSGGPDNYGIGYELYIEAGQQELSLYIADSSSMHFGRSSNNAVKLRDSRWHHVLVVFDRSTAIAKYYIDGKADGQRSLQNLSGSITNSQNLSIGKYGNNTDYFIGQIDDVQIFNYALTQTQISTLYNGGAVRWGQ